MMMIRSIWLLFFTSKLTHVYGGDPEDLPPYDVLVEFSLASLDDKVDHPHLRRGLQTVVCSANDPHTLSGNCPASYPCTCIGSTETSCSYCELDSTRGHICLVTDSTTTFVNRQTGIMQTCSCHYANGQANQSCIDLENRSQTGNPQPVPITLPPTIPPSTLPPTTPSPIPQYSLQDPTSSPIPPATLPPTTPSSIPQYSLQDPTSSPIPPFTPPPTTPLPLPPYQPPVFTCRATVAHDVLSDNGCSGTYACMCGSTATTCPYCTISTTQGPYCIGAGSTITFVEPQTAALTICSCDVVNGVAQEYCGRIPL